MLVDLNTQHDHPQHARNAKDILTEIENQIGWGQGYGNLHHRVVKDVLEPENHEFARYKTQSHATECDSRKIQSDFSSWNWNWVID